MRAIIVHCRPIGGAGTLAVGRWGRSHELLAIGHLLRVQFVHQVGFAQLLGVVNLHLGGGGGDHGQVGIRLITYIKPVRPHFGPSLVPRLILLGTRPSKLDTPETIPSVLFRGDFRGQKSIIWGCKSRLLSMCSM